MRVANNSLYCSNLVGSDTDFRNINTGYSSIINENIIVHSDKRRARVLEVTIYKSLIIIAIIISLIIGIGRLVTVNASDLGDKKILNKYYTSIEVHAEDTLWELAGQYNNGEESRNNYIDSIKKLNDMTSDTLYSGQNILVYYYSEVVK